ncbi:MAG: type II secretion system F family protein [Candidatus Omnitrophota bacterium]|jgi:type IV pilus assembly protein PilC|nr:type II secretion system F family protein [Candidatus Omnitrophota bacterium]MDD5538144.1 type II secretion system F family protein [Candidatus Omnitrophota bacterium]
MPKFSYICRKPTGEKEVGVIEGASQDEVVAQLQRKGLFITSIIPFDVGRKEAAAAAQEVRTVKKQFTHGGVNSHDLVLFARQLAMLLGAGVSLLRALDVIAKQVDSKKLAGIVGQVALDMEAGRTLRDALSKFPDIFSSLWINLIETGEASGNLPMVLDKLAYYLEESANFKRKIVSALLYPGILLFVSVSAVFFFVIKIVPTFATILVNFGVELPLPTKILINTSTLLTKNLFLIVICVMGFVFLFRYLKRRPPFDRIIEDISFRVPIFGEFLRFMYLERFATTMSILIESGVPILYALEISERSAGSIRMTDAISYIKRNVKEGRSMAVPMEKSEFFTPMVVQMIAIGEEIGELSNMLKRIAKYYQEYLETFVSRLATIFEPLMIVFIGVIIGGMVISIFMPIFSIAFMKTN